MGTALLEITESPGVPLDKLVIGKPVGKPDVINTGWVFFAFNADLRYMTGTELNKCVKDARGKGWNGGVMGWQMRAEGQQFFKDATAD